MCVVDMESPCALGELNQASNDLATQLSDYQIYSQSGDICVLQDVPLH